MAAMASHFRPRVIIVENVFALLDWPEVLAQADAAYDAVGYSRVVTHRIRHDEVGGDSTRHRVFLIYEEHDNPLPLPQEIVSSEAFSSSLSRHLLPPGCLPDTCFLDGQFTPVASTHAGGAQLAGHLRWQEGEVLRRGSLVTLSGSSSTWRVMGFQQGRVQVLRNNRKYPSRRTVSRQAVVRRCPQRLPVYSIHSVSKSPRAFGEWPVRTVMLVLDDRLTPPRVRALEPAEVWSLMELQPSLLQAALDYGIDQDHVYRLAGNSIPASMLQPVAESVVNRLQCLDAGQYVPSGTSAQQTVTALLALVHFDNAAATHLSSRVYVTADGLLPSALQPPGASRASSVAAARTLLPPPLDEVPGFLVAERLTDQGAVRVVTVPTAHLQQWTLPGSWVYLQDIATVEHRECAQLSALATARLRDEPIHSSPDHVPSASETPLSEGKRPRKRVRPHSIACDTTAGQWERTQAQALATRQDMRDALLAISPEDPDFEYLQSWVPRVLEPPLSEVPLALRNDLGTYNDPALQSVLFSDKTAPPITAPLARLPAQTPVPGFAPTTLRHILKDVVLDELIPTWLRAMLHDLRNYRLHGPEASRTCNWVLAVGQDLFHEQARGKVWDLRRLSEGVITLLDYDAPLDSKLNLDFIREQLQDFPDQELVSFLLEGVQFKADLLLQLVFLPHLLSLSHGIFSVEEELKKLASNDYYGLFQHLPFLPCRLQPLGAVPRKLGPWRRIMDAGAPRKLVFDTAGWSVVALNEAAKGVTSWHQSDPDPLPPVYDMGRWPPEIKPHLADYARDASILKYTAFLSGEPLICFNDDISNYFHSFALAPQELWKVCCLYLPLDEEHAVHTFAAEYVLAMGIFHASNIAQRASHAIVHLVNLRMEELEAQHPETDPELVSWLQARRALNEGTRSPQDRLWALGMYTDDSHGSVLGISRAIRLLRAWHHVMKGFGFVMASPEKRQLGTTITSLGALFFLAEGLIIIPQHKLVRALAALKRVCSGTILQAEYRTLLGLLEHLLILHCGRRDIMYGLYRPLRNPQGPSDPLGSQSRGLISQQAARWQQLLLTTPGCNFFHSLPSAPQVSPVGGTFHLYSDAAIEGTQFPALGGYFHGYYWDLPLTVELLRLHITHLELMGAIVNIILFVQVVLPTTSIDLALVHVVAHCDALTSVDVLGRTSARSDMMQILHLLLLDTPEFQQVQHVLSIEHIWGEANFLSDAASRGNLPLLHLMCSQLGVSPQRLELPSSALCLVRTAYEFFCKPKFGDKGYEGEGPAFVMPTLKALSFHNTSFSARRVAPPTSLHSTFKSPARVSVASCPPSSSGQLVPPRCSRSSIPVRQQRAVPSPAALRGLALRSIIPQRTFGTASRAPSAHTRQHVPQHVTATQSCTVLSSPHSSSVLARPSTSAPLRRQAPCPPEQLSVRMADLLRSDISEFSMVPADGNWSDLNTMCSEFERALQSAGNPSTVHKYRLHWDQYWTPFAAKYLQGKEFRTDSSVLTSATAASREMFIQYCFLIYCRRLMPARSIADRAAGKMAKPKSVVAPLKAVRYLHQHAGYGHLQVDLSLLSKALRGFAVDFKTLHGEDSLLPERKYAMPFAVTNAMITIPDGTRLGKSTANKVQRAQLRWQSFFAALALCKVTGYRKAEVSVPSVHYAAGLFFSNLVWFIAGVEVPFPTVEQMLMANETYIAAVAPPPAKADRTREKYGYFRAYIRWSPALSNAANALAKLEAAFPVQPAARSTTPLFCTAPMVPFTHAQLDALLAKALQHVASTQPALLNPDHLHRFSWHSLRRGLASGLWKLKAPDAIIQMYCRWASPQSLEAYALLDAEQYSDTLALAEQQTFQTIAGRPDYGFPTIDDDAQHIDMVALAEVLDSAAADDV